MVVVVLPEPLGPATTHSVGRRSVIEFVFTFGTAYSNNTGSFFKPALLLCLCLGTRLTSCLSNVFHQFLQHFVCRFFHRGQTVFLMNLSHNYLFVDLCKDNYNTIIKVTEQLLFSNI